MLVGPVEVSPGVIELGGQLPGGGGAGGLVRVSPGNNFQVPSGVLVLGAMPATLPTGGIATNAAQTWVMPANTAAAFAITDGTNTYYNMDTRTGVTAVAVHTFDATDPSFASAATSSYKMVSIGAFTWTLTGGVAVTTTNPGPVSLVVNTPTLTSASATTVAVVSTAQINGPLAAGAGPVTITTAIGLDIPTWVGTNETTAIGVRIAGPSGAGTNQALTVTGAAISLNDSSNFNTTINTGTSTGAVTIGNSVAGLITIANKPAVAATFKITDGTNNYVAIDTRVATDNVTAITFGLTGPSYASANGSTFSNVKVAAYTMTWTGGVTVTAAEGLSFYDDAVTITTGQATTITAASQATFAGLKPGTNTTITTGIHIHLLDGPTKVGTYTNQVGIKIDALAQGATLNTAIWVQNPIQVGSSSLTTNNQINTASQGAGTTTLYIGNASITVSSDMRLKTQIVPTRLNALDTFKKLRVVDFWWNDPSDPNRERDRRGAYTGLLAQETIDVLPWIVNAPDRACLDCRAGRYCSRHPESWHVEYDHAVPLLVRGFQEVSTWMETIEERVRKLERTALS